MLRYLRIGLVLILFASVAAQVEAKRIKAKDALLPQGWPEITEEQSALTEVAYARGAPAVVLLETQHYEWEGIEFKRDRYFRRIKILTEDGVEDHGSYSFTLYGEWRVQKVLARTVLPGGQVIDAEENINREKSEDGVQVIQISFPQVQAGAILDLDIRMNTDGLSVEPWTIQERIPVLDTRLVLMPPPSLSFRVAPQRLPAEKSKPDAAIPIAGGKKAFFWQLLDVPSLPDVANLPPLEDISQRLFVILQHYKDQYSYIPIAADWPTWNKRVAKDWEEWMTKKKHSASDELGRSVAAEATGALEKAEAIRLALKERFQVDRVSRYVYQDSPDELLEKGSGTSGALAALAVVMLRAAGVDADLAALRRRSDGIVPAGFPVPGLLNDLMVRIADGDDHRFISPAGNMHVSRLPFDCSGVLAMPLDGESETPEIVPDFKARDNRSWRSIQATLSDDGALEAKSTQTYKGVAAEAWRFRLRDRAEEAQRERIQNSLRGRMPGLELQSFEISNLDDASQDLVIKAEWTVDGFATVAGKRLIFNPNLYETVATDDWAPETRRYEIDLGTAYETRDTLMLKMPEGVGDITVPDRATFDAGPVGSFETTFDRRGAVLVAKRNLRLEMYRFGTEAYSGLRAWFSDIAKMDEKPVVLQLQ